MTSNKAGRGSLRAVEPKNERSPSYKGSVELEGKKYWLSGWRRMGDDGKYWLSPSVEAADEPAEPVRTYANRRDYQDEQPF